MGGLFVERALRHESYGNPMLSRCWPRDGKSDFMIPPSENEIVLRAPASLTVNDRLTIVSSVIQLVALTKSS